MHETAVVAIEAISPRMRQPWSNVLIPPFPRGSASKCLFGKRKKTVDAEEMANGDSFDRGRMREDSHLSQAYNERYNLDAFSMPTSILPFHCISRIISTQSIS